MFAPPGCRLPGSSWCSRLTMSLLSATGVIAMGWPLTEELQDRPWGPKDFRILDPAVLPADHGPGRLTKPAE